MEPREDPVARLTATVEELSHQVGRLRAVVADQAAELDRLRPAPAAPEAASPPGVAPASATLDRRAALRRGGALAAAAVAGGTALVAGSASPAAAATVEGSGNPGVRATGVGSGAEGLVATATESNAVRATASGFGGTGISAKATGAYGYAVFAEHTNMGTAIVAICEATNNSSPTLIVRRTAPQPTSGAIAVTTVGGTTGLVVSNDGGPYLTDVGSAIYSHGFARGARLVGTQAGVVAEGPCAQVVLRSTTTTPPAQRTEAYEAGSLVWDGTDLWLCVVAGTPGTWRKVAAPPPEPEPEPEPVPGTLTVLPTPVRAYDSRPAAPPEVGPKTKLEAGVTRALDLSVAVPDDATAALVTILLVNATVGAGNFTVWAGGVAKPLANTMVWGGDAGRFTGTAVTALGEGGTVSVSASLPTHLVLDVVGYYR